jgi:hypothetical protein
MKIIHSAKIICVTIAAIASLLCTGCQTNEMIGQAKPIVKINKYQYVYETVSWHEAKARAEAAGGQLACLETVYERDYVTSLRGHQGIIDASTGKLSPLPSPFNVPGKRDNFKTIWVGLTDEDMEGKWNWVNGAQLDPRMLGYIERGRDLQYRDYAHLMRQGGFLSREATGQTPRGWNASRHVEGFLIEWEQ